MNSALAPVALLCVLGAVAGDCMAQEPKAPQAGGASTSEDVRARAVRQDVVASWLVEIVGESRPRTLIVRGAENRNEGTWDLDASYGFTDGNKSAVKATLHVRPDGYRLEFVTGSASQVIVEGGRDGVFSGTFTTNRGRQSAVRLVRTAEDRIGQLASDLKASKAALATPPGPDVPEWCARYFGGWEGSWSGDPVPVKLWVLAIKADCTAQVRYRSTTTKEIPEPSDLATVTIGKSGFDRPCGGDGTCRFVLDGREMTVTYSHFSYSTKSTALQKFR